MAKHKVSISCRTKSGAPSRSKSCKETGCYTRKITTCAPKRGADGRFKSGKRAIYGIRRRRRSAKRKG